MSLLKPGESHTATGEKLREDVGDARKVLQTLLKELGWGEKSSPPSQSWKIRSKGFALSLKLPSHPLNASASSFTFSFPEAAASAACEGPLTALATPLEWWSHH